jgi:Flp pilus assembly protein TadG
MIRFWQDKRGSVAVIVAVSAMLLVVIAGAAVDFATAYYVRVSLQSALDSAALAAGRADVDPIDSNDVTEQKLTAEAQSVFNANFKLSPRLATVQQLQVSYTPPVGITPDNVLVSVTADMPTNFLHLAGIPKFDFNIQSKSQPPQAGPIDLALVLDMTLSMKDPPATGGAAKVDTLKTAAKDLVHETMRSGSSDIMIGVVPYSTYVNVGAPPPTPSWILPIERKVDHCTYEFPNAKCKDPVTYDCLVDGVMQKNACSIQDCSAKGKMTCPTGGATSTYKWAGCVGARSVLAPNHSEDIGLNSTTEAYLDNLSDPTSVRYPGISTFSAPKGCGPTLLPLTSAVQKQTVIDKIDALVPLGDTHIPAGLIWGWNILAPGEPYDARKLKDLKAIGGRKVLVLMTDGINSLSPRLYDGAYATNGDAARLNLKWRDGSETNKLTSRICENIKKDGIEDGMKDGIEIFTVLFDVPEGSETEKILKNCATGGSAGKNWFVATNTAGLLSAFRKITDQLKTLKLVE